MKFIKVFFASISVMLAVVPAVVRADVITQDMLNAIAQDPGNQGNSCALSNSIAASQIAPLYGQTKVTAPVWKNISAKAGITLSIPWSPYWYIVGKQINWYDYDLSEGSQPTQYHFGRYQAGNGCGLIGGDGCSLIGDGCSLIREYYVDIHTGQTLKTYLNKKADPSTVGMPIESMSINGRPAALETGTNPFCDQESIAVQVTKAGKPSVVVFSHMCGDLNAEMLRMAARVK